MRIWSLNPKYLDSKGLVALWRETLLAKNVLEEKTKGYKNHPQLIRFKAAENPLEAINYYLQIVWEEAESRSYKFNKDKFSVCAKIPRINVTDKQLLFEIKHLFVKLKARDEEMFHKLQQTDKVETHPLFKLTKGEIEGWERI